MLEGIRDEGDDQEPAEGGAGRHDRQELRQTLRDLHLSPEQSASLKDLIMNK